MLLVWSVGPFPLDTAVKDVLVLQMGGVLRQGLKSIMHDAI
jgi:hypothetical protein